MESKIITELIISEALKGFKTIDYRTLTDLQGNAKELSQKNFDRLYLAMFGTAEVRNTFDHPIVYWAQSKGTKKEKIHIFDGHQRINVLKTIDALPYELPCYEILAKTLKEAKEKWATKNSDYGKKNKEGLDEFFADIDKDFLKEIADFDKFLDIDFADKNKEIDTNEFSDKMYLKLEYSEGEYHKVKNELSNLGITAENALFQFLFPNE